VSLEGWVKVLRIIVAVALAPAVALGWAAAQSGFTGTVAVEWDDTDIFNRHKVRLLDDFGFVDSGGKQWMAHKGAELDGASFPPLVQQMVGYPFVGEQRRAGLLHDYFAKTLTQDWKAVRRMYYEALLAEGHGETEAKTAYAVLYAAGMRWEVKGSSCYVNCHAGASALRWRPDVMDFELEAVVEALGTGNPTLDEIDALVDAAVPRPGPHLFSQLRKEEGSGDPADEEDSILESSEVSSSEELPPE